MWLRGGDTLRRSALRTPKLGVDSGMQRVTDDRWRRAPPNRFRPNLLRLDWGSPQKKGGVRGDYALEESPNTTKQHAV